MRGAALRVAVLQCQGASSGHAMAVAGKSLVAASWRGLRTTNALNQKTEAKRSRVPLLAGGLAAAGLAVGITYYLFDGEKEQVVEQKKRPQAGERVQGLKDYSADEIARHNKIDSDVWVSYRDGVYDITKLIPKHPSKKEVIASAAGKPVEPFFDKYPVHKGNPHVLDWLESFRIGNLREKNPSAGDRVAGLREYSAAEVATHADPDQDVWVTYRNGVYDITKLIPKHPSDKEIIVQAAGGPVEPFWEAYPVHKDNPHVLGWLESLRIGNLREKDVRK